MSASQRPGEITYYEELGVENTASADEIRDSFRALVRLLHPDQHSDPTLKDMAERQMRKINRIHAVLSDAARRTAYDESLLSSRNAPVIVFSNSDGNLKKLLVRGGATAAIAFGVFLLIWFAAGSNTTTEVRGQDARGLAGRAGDVYESDAADQIAQLRDRVRTLEAERNSALQQLGRLSGKDTGLFPAEKPVVRRATTPAAATSLDELPGVTQSVTDSGLARGAGGQSAVPAAEFAGFWTYSKSGGSASPSSKEQYAPDYIELAVTEQDGKLRGQYRSRYQVLDHAISPDVDFVFAGKPNGSALSCAWQGPGGAKGRMTLRLTPANTVEITWNASELGSQQWLVSGTATLYKK